METFPKKDRAALNWRDPRCNGNQPIEVSLIDMFSVEKPMVDLEDIHVVKAACKANIEKNLIWPVGKRELTFEEACFGIPGCLKSVNVNTGPGFPLMELTKNHKKDYIWFDENGNGSCSEDFRQMVNNYQTEIEWQRHSLDVVKRIGRRHKFIGYLKDELLKSEKIAKGQTRVIYCNDMIAMVFMRMKWGAFLSAACHNFERTIFGIGLNQYSYDMDAIQTYLSSHGPNVTYIAGDYKGFDKRCHPQFQRAAYEIIGELCDWNQDYLLEFLYSHECESKAVLGPYEFRTVANHMSGCFFTSAINCIVNDLYMRYAFMKICPGMIFDQHVRATYQGDDHILGVTGAEHFTPITVSSILESIGQEYTSADKTTPLSYQRDRFENVTFLGAEMKLIQNRWTGIMKPETILEILHWTRDNDFTLCQLIETCLGYAAMRDDDTYNIIMRALNEFLCLHPSTKVEYASREEMRQIIPMRVAGSGLSFWAEGPMMRCTGSSVKGLTGFASSDVRTSDMLCTKRHDKASHGLEEDELDIGFGTNSFVFAKEVKWATTDLKDAILFDVDVPFGIFDLINTENLQFMPFKNFIYYTTDIEIGIQIAGSPFHAGLIVVMFIPLTDRTTINHRDMMTYNHFMASPCRNTTGSLRMPFRYFRGALNTYAGGLEEESLGHFSIRVLSPLNVSASSSESDISINVYFKFPMAKFTIPRPPGPINGKVHEWRNATDEEMTLANPSRNNQPIMFKPGRSIKFEPFSGDLDMIAEGSSYSINKKETNYNIENTYSQSSIAGSTPLNLREGDMAATSKTDNTTDISLKASGLPFDNPPLTGCTVPVHQKYPSMSTNRGLRPTHRMDFAVDLMNTGHIDMHDACETRLSSLLARKTYLGTYEWNTSTINGTMLVKYPLNSILAEPENAELPYLLSTPLGILNYYRFWRADIQFEFVVARTSFHNGRLLATVGYGAPETQVVTNNRNIFYNEVLEYTGDNDVNKLCLNFNSANPSLFTYMGPNAKNRIQDFSLGSLMITVQNQLRAPDTVAQSVQLIVFVSFHNVQLYESRTAQVVCTNHLEPAGINGYINPVIVNEAAADDEEMQGEGPRPRPEEDDEMGEIVPADPVMEGEPDKTVGEVPETRKLTASGKLEQPKPYQTSKVSKFSSYNVDIIDFMRRYYRVPITSSKFSRGLDSRIVYLPITPLHPLANNYAAWAGSLSYRLFYGNDTRHDIRVFWTNEVYCGPKYTPVDINGDFVEFGQCASIQTVPLVKNGHPVTVQLQLDSLQPTIVSGPMEMPYAITGTDRYIDITVPFNTIYHMCPTLMTRDNDEILADLNSLKSHISPIIGWVVIYMYAEESDTYMYSFREIYQSVGDDFRLYCYRGSNNYYHPYTSVGLSDPRQIYNNYFG
jgi:hypothetical protein